jgi:hypothetical protein
MTTYLRKNTNYLYGDKHQFKVFNNDGEISEAFKKRVRSRICSEA